ncbi:hypothetical protein KR215_007250 [Drosophila sulfurigaster]|uniref:Uncharacterized protein LOC117570113 n=1 Tax=Drosophila albomicans TaxID=7291 RepID=A0A6P8YLH1_DROAB|nr:uncharacterized protein LOC117570113 [Drosophila albomicans]XP_060656360.1 uncharacterized protein LOC132791452 [Drosophila nasuta]XP_062130721.1 uncharacterized protein LOC133841897 [Drosophila sulfurigaster albostrigata]KAH8396992.1 hypothetical protein KR215_007250 [Drosophila sulfurigaster]
MYSEPQQGTQSTQTVPQPAPPAQCVPLTMVDEDGKVRYCYHGGKCRCENCRIFRQNQQDELDRNLDAFIPHSRLKLEPAIRQVKHKQYRLEATRTSPQMAKMLLDDHMRLIEEYPTYYLPDKYYVKDAWRIPGPQEVGTQTEILIGNYGIDGCPCADKTVCWDI